MKTRDFLFGMLACAAFSACTSDDVVDNGTKEFKDKAYMRVQIAMAGNSSSRGAGGEYEYGTGNEQKVNDVNFFFYDAAGKFVTAGEAVTNPTITGNGTDKQYWEAETAPVISLKLEAGKPFPTQVVAYVNIGNSNTIDFGSDRTLAKDGQKIAEATKFAPTAFVMTSSTYVDGNEVVQSTPVSSANFHETEAAAKNDPNIVTIHVERLPAKVKVTTANAQITEIEDASGNMLKFNVEGFALNGVNISSYLQKQVDVNWGTGDLKDWANWTSPNEFRCFWAKDMNYDVKPGLAFYDYTDLAPTMDAKYCYENTMELPLTGNLFENATHVLVFGKYQIKFNGESQFQDLNNEDFFMYAGTAYLADDLKELWANAIKDVYKHIAENQYETASPDCYELVSDGTVDGVVLKLRTDITLYKKNGDNFEVLNPATKNNELKDVYTATGYHNGIGYFPVLIEHFGQTNDTAEKKEYDLTSELGVVRNHIYNLEIQKIENLAEGMFNPEVVIIPDSSVKTYYLASKLRILSWKNVNQGVNL